MIKRRLFRWRWWMVTLGIGLAIFTSKSATHDTVLAINGAGTVDQHAPTQRNGASTSATLAPSSWWRSVKQKFDGRQWDIYTDQRLTDHAADDVQPRFNTGATQIAFVSNRDGNNEIYRIDADGANLIRLTAHPADDQTPDWSPDNRTILFVSDRDGNPELYRMGANGTDAVRLTFAPEADLYPSWSPDGEQIAWVRGAGSEAAIWVMNTDGSQARPLSEPLHSAARVRWSPDGTALAFDYDLNHDGRNEPALIQADGTGLHLLSCGPEVLQDLLLSTWLPDGSAVVASKIIYRRVGGKLVVEATYLNAILVTECWRQYEYEWHNEDTRLLDVEHTDPWPPSSHVRPLPPFSRLPDLLLSFVGQDVGPAGVWHYQLQLRSDVNTSWFTHWQLTAEDLMLPRLPPGKLYFRSRANDFAENWEPWPPDEVVHAETTMFARWLTGSVHDLRGHPLAGRPLEISPPPLTPVTTNGAGAFLAYLGGSGRHTLNGETTLSMAADRHRQIYELPVQNLIVNGGFEDAPRLAGWHTDGAPLPTVSTENPHSGHNVARLGHACTGICPPYRVYEPIQTCTPAVHPGCAPDETLDYGFGFEHLVADRNDNVHLFGATPLSQLYYQRRAADGSWQWPEVLPELPHRVVTVLTDDTGVLSFLWADYPDTIASPLHFFRQRRADESWSAAEALGPSAHPLLALDGRDQIHLMYTDRTVLQLEEYQLFYRVRTADGIWSPAELVTTIRDSRLDHALAVLGDGTVYTFWVERDRSGWARQFLVYRVRQPDGGWSAIHTVAEDAPIETIRARRTSDNGLHVIWSGNGQTFYSTLPVGGDWSAPEALGLPVWAFLVDGADTLYAVGSGHAPSDAIDYRARPLGGEWGEQTRAGIGTDYALPAAIATGAANSFHTIWSTGFGSFSHEYYTTPWITQTGESLLSQTVHIPADLYHPTLAFLYTLAGGTTGGSYFGVKVNDSVTTTEILRITEIAPAWRQAWTDMEAWAGQTVTVTFGVYGQENDTAMTVLLDQVSLGPWKTPVIQDLYPERIEADIATTLIITGENFLGTPAVRIGGQTLAAVHRVSEQRLEVTLPGTLPPGLYWLEVTNPDGENYLRTTALAIGQLRWLPLIGR